MSTVEHQTAKDQMIAILQNQPDDSSYDELLRELAAARSIERGLQDAEAGRVVSNDDALLLSRSGRNRDAAVGLAQRSRADPGRRHDSA
ncbi:hypothetical protein KOR34_45500 [Posidoniimonas corsicana]|uniref:Uncharacterized protein n=1 Tax=Posidoniimonas corsicana TaxID=1938618 RepID=A0A5C5UXU3_9BACT|nr:hypothetical protein [Posidoniimonas corsicana]TWT31174.1 hypothetical protein KOR34_45500 [Posidoniimonas corsicana]